MSVRSRADIIRLDKSHVWHPYTAMQKYIDETEPLVITRAEGSRIFDADGRSYIDANASWWVATLGHKHPRLMDALRRQTETLCHTSLAGVTHEPAAALAEQLTAIAPGQLNWVFYSDDGSTAVEAAIKMALKYWRNCGKEKKTRFVALSGAFHGETLGVTSLGGVEIFRRPFAGVLMECLHIPPPTDAGDSVTGQQTIDSSFRALEETLASGAETIAALVIEPLVQGATGMRMYGAEYLRRLREVTDKHDVLLIVDEVFTGYGRTGTMWACDAGPIAPDIICLAKGFTSGVLPMAATLVTNRVFEAFLGEPERAFHYGHSFCGHPLGCAVALEVLAIFRDENIVNSTQSKSARIASRFAALGKLDGTKHARSLGMIGAIDLSGSAQYLGTAGWHAFAEARKRGVFLRPLGDVVYVAPPLNIPDDTLDELLDVVEDSVKVALAVASS